MFSQKEPPLRSLKSPASTAKITIIPKTRQISDIYYLKLINYCCGNVTSAGKNTILCCSFNHRKSYDLAVAVS